jgi:uncharacterized protein YhaN
MILKRLDLKAFGHFTNRILEFDSKEPGLHIIYGPNEAGKSSSLRALKALLYGFPERTSDNFLHANDQLLVGGVIEGDKGRELTFLRRKKRKADLLDIDGNPMEPGMLASFLHGIEPALFESLYGIDHKTLVDGGEDILAQKGEVGQALFAAGAGISSLRKILDSLDVEADDLFRARGAKQQINQAVKEYKELKKLIREKSLLPGKWKEHKKRLQDVEAEQDALEKERREKSAEVQRLDRLSKAIPELAELENLQKQLDDIGDVVVLPLEFSEQVRQVEQNIRENKLQLDKDRDLLDNLHKKREGISLNQLLLDHAETIEDLHQRLGEYRKGQKDRYKLDGMRIAHRKDAGALIEEIRPELKLEDADSLRPVLGKKRTIQNLSSQHESLIQRITQANSQKDDAENKLKEISGTLSGLPDVRDSEGLANSLKLAQRLGEIDQQIEAISREFDSGKQNCQAELGRLGLWTGDQDKLLKLILPLQETVRRFETDFSEIDKERVQLKKDRQKAEGELKSAKSENKEIVYGGEVPTEVDLEESRQKRQNGWQLLRRKWLGGEDISSEAEVYDHDQELPEAYETHVEQSDHIADRLRREAERVAKSASLRARIESLEAAIKEIIQLEQKLTDKEDSLVATWQAVWQPINIEPLSPKEMLAWLTDIDTLRFKVSETLVKEGELKAKETARQKHRAALLKDLKALCESVDHLSAPELAPVVVFAELVIGDIARHKSEREKIYDKKTQVQSELDKSIKEQKTAEVAIVDWQIKWDKSLVGLELKGQILPSEALDLLETIGDCFDKLEKAKELQSRIDGIDRDVDKFTDDVHTLLKEASPDLKDLSPDQSVIKLHSLLGKARQDSELLKTNNAEVEALAAEIEGTEKTQQSLDKQMAELLLAAKCDKAVELPEVISKFNEQQRLQKKISEAESTLAKVSEGVSREEIKRQATEVNVDELPGQITSLKRQIEEELHPKIKNTSEIIGEENKELQLMDGSTQAAEASEKMEQVAARIRRLVDQFTRIKLATVVLKDEIERYREEHQDPVLKIASKYFSELTLGSFAGLRTDVADNGNLILVGVRPDDSRLTVHGMSSGTCDQLYLALRMATLEWRLESSEPMPFIVDDILINFDDERSKATLTALAGLSKKNQVILFTHHSQIMETAKEMKIAEVHVHEI